MPIVTNMTNQVLDDVYTIENQSTTSIQGTTTVINVDNTSNESVTIVDNLDSTSADEALSANQGNILNTKLSDMTKYKNRVGERVKIMESDWANQSIGNQWTAYNSPVSTFNISTNKVTVSAANGTSLNKMHYYNLYKTASKRLKIRALIKSLSGTSAGAYGLLFSLAPIANTFGGSSFQWMLNADTVDVASNRIACYTAYLTTNKIYSTAKMPTVNANDMIEMTCYVENSAIRIVYNNITQNATISYLVRFDSLTVNPFTCCNLGIGCEGGSWELSELEVIDNELVNLDLLFVGDSISSGVKITDTGRDFPAIVANRFPTYSVSRFSSGYDGLMIYSDSIVLNELVARKPKYAFMLLGTNDLGLYSRTLQQMQADYTTIVNALKAVGTKIIHAGLLPRNTIDVRPFNAWVKSNFASELQIDVFSCLCADGVSPIVSGSTAYGINATYNTSSDGIHPSDAGDLVLADNISMFLIANNIFNSSLMLNNVPV